MSDFELKRNADLESRLASEKFETSNYIREVALSFDSGFELKQHKRRIQMVAEQTAQKLKHNVYKNFELFIDTSKEISSLEAEMYQLSHLLHEHESLTQTLQSVSLMEDKEGLQGGGEGNSTHEKHSISALLETVEGGSIVTEVPDRYLVHSGHLVELDQETYEAVNLVRAFLLNDSLMIGAHIRKMRGPVRYKFQAIYELDSMAIVDVKDSDTMRYAFKILMFPDSHLYQAENEENKKSWLETLEAAKQKHKKGIETAKLEANNLANKQAFPSAISGMATPSAGLAESAGNGQEELLSDWVKDAPERLDVFVAQRDFDQAVTLIEKTKIFLKESADSFANRDVRIKIDHRINKVVDVLTKELESSPNGSLRGGPRTARRAVGLLLRLGRSDKACSLFLENHRQIIERDLDDVKMEGTVTLYIANYAATFFSGLRNAALEFERAFGDNDGSYSSFIVWCNNQLRNFFKKSSTVIFQPGIYSLSSVADCITAVMKECDSLNTIGMDLGFALLTLLHPHLSQALDEERTHIREQCAILGTAETWTCLDLGEDKAQLASIQLQMETIGISDFKNMIHEAGMVDLSQTTINFCKLVFSFTDEVLRFYTPELLEVFVDCFCDIFHNMMVLFCDALSRDENLPMTRSINKDTNFICENFLLAMANKINKKTGVNVPELVELHASLQDTFEKKSRETTPANPSADSTRPAEPYCPQDDDSEEGNSLASGGVNDGISNSEDEDDIV